MLDVIVGDNRELMKLSPHSTYLYITVHHLLFQFLKVTFILKEILQFEEFIGTFGTFLILRSKSLRFLGKCEK